MNDQETAEFLAELKEHAKEAMDIVAKNSVHSEKLSEVGQHMSTLSALVALNSTMMTMISSLYPTAPLAVACMTECIRDISYKVADATRTIERLIEEEQNHVEQPQQSEF